MKKEPIDGLRLLFLRLIAEESDAATVLFSLRDAGELMRRYGVSVSLINDALPKTGMTLWEKEIFFFKEQNYAFVQSMIGEP